MLPFEGVIGEWKSAIEGAAGGRRSAGMLTWWVSRSIWCYLQHLSHEMVEIERWGVPQLCRTLCWIESRFSPFLDEFLVDFDADWCMERVRVLIGMVWTTVVRYDIAATLRFRVADNSNQARRYAKFCQTHFQNSVKKKPVGFRK